MILEVDAVRPHDALALTIVGAYLFVALVTGYLLRSSPGTASQFLHERPRLCDTWRPECQDRAAREPRSCQTPQKFKQPHAACLSVSVNRAVVPQFLSPRFYRRAPLPPWTHLRHQPLCFRFPNPQVEEIPQLMTEDARPSIECVSS